MSTPTEQLIAHLDQVAHDAAAGVDPDEAADGGAALLFTGRAQVVVPELLLHQVRKQQLDPGTAIVWQMLRCAVTGTQPVFHRLNAFIQQQIHCSRPKAGEIIALLRLKRWLTLREVRNNHGYRLPFVALLHDSPLALDETMRIDPGFRAYLLRARNHRNGRIAAAASELADRLEQTANSVGNQPVAAQVKKIDLGTRPDQKILLREGAQIKKIDQGKPTVIQPLAPQIKKVDLGSEGCSSCSNTTTTTDPGEEIHYPAHARVRELLPSVREVIGRSRLPSALLQQVVFEWAGALITTDSRIQRPIPYLRSLLSAAERGEFVISELGLREQGKALAPQLPSPPPEGQGPKTAPRGEHPPADWSKCLESLRAQVTEREYTTWLAPLTALEEGDAVRVYAPNPFVSARVRADYLPLLQAFYADRSGEVTVSQEVFR